MKVVTNSTPLIALSKINRLELLREVYGTIYIPEEIYTEAALAQFQSIQTELDNNK